MYDVISDSFIQKSNETIIHSMIIYAMQNVLITKSESLLNFQNNRDV